MYGIILLFVFVLLRVIYTADDIGNDVFDYTLSVCKYVIPAEIVAIILFKDQSELYVLVFFILLILLAGLVYILDYTNSIVKTSYTFHCVL